MKKKNHGSIMETVQARITAGDLLRRWLCIRGELGGGLILFGISSMRQNPTVWGFVYQGAGKSDINHSPGSEWFMKNAHVAGTLWGPRFQVQVRS